MSDLNQCTFTGRLGRDPETRYTPGGDAVTSFSIACAQTWKDKASGEKKERTEWVRCVAWRKLGEICGEYLKKGSQVLVVGEAQTRKWQDKEGNDRYTTEYVLEKMQMLGGKTDGQRSSGEPREERGEQPQREQARSQQTRPAASGGAFDDLDDDIPF